MLFLLLLLVWWQLCCCHCLVTVSSVCLCVCASVCRRQRSLPLPTGSYSANIFCCATNCCAKLLCWGPSARGTRRTVTTTTSATTTTTTTRGWLLKNTTDNFFCYGWVTEWVVLRVCVNVYRRFLLPRVSTLLLVMTTRNRNPLLMFKYDIWHWFLTRNTSFLTPTSLSLLLPFNYA